MADFWRSADEMIRRGDAEAAAPYTSLPPDCPCPSLRLPLGPAARQAYSWGLWWLRGVRREGYGGEGRG